MNTPRIECKTCGQPLDPTDRFCRSCGIPAGANPGFGLFRRPVPSPEQTASYWHNFFRPFFVIAFIFFGMFFLASLILIAIWFFMFRT
jgi:hypothetical protein